MRVITITVEADTNGFLIFTHQHGRAFGGWSGGEQLWDRIDIRDFGNDWAACLPSLRKSLAKAAYAAGIVLRPRTVEYFRDELAILSPGDEALDS